MFIRGKPIRFGYKLWVLASPNGYPFRLILFADASERTEEPLGTRVVNQLLEVVDKGKFDEHTITFDNLFGSWALLTDLASRNMRAICTARDNRTNKCPLIDSKDMKKRRQKSDYDWRCDGTVTVSKWYDNAVVNVASNHEHVEPTRTRKRNESRYSNHAW